MKLLFTLLFIAFFSVGAVSPDNSEFPWVLKKEKHGIRVFTRDIQRSNLKELKIEMNFINTTIPDILNVIMNSDTYPEWVYKCSEASDVQEISDKEDISYYKFDFPWPFSDRDAYMKSTVSMDENQQNVTIKTRTVDGFFPPDKDVIRMKQHFNQWSFVQIDPKKVALTYTAKSDPAGNIPDWLVNLAVDRGPTETLNNLRNLIANR